MFGRIQMFIKNESHTDSGDGPKKKISVDNYLLNTIFIAKIKGLPGRYRNRFRHH
jgi:hypothetical protein